MAVSMVKRIKNWLDTLLRDEKCAHRCALACALGVYVAFSPFFGFHTIMVVLLSWFFAASFPVMLAVSIFVNNPWTMVPVYGSGYLFGDWFLRLFGIDQSYNPQFLAPVNQWISAKLGFSGVSLWAYLFGGNVLGLVGGLVTYPLMRHYLRLMYAKPALQFDKPKALAKLFVFKASRAMHTSKAKAQRAYLTIMYAQFGRPQL